MKGEEFNRVREAIGQQKTRNLKREQVEKSRFSSGGLFHTEQKRRHIEKIAMSVKMSFSV